MVEFVKKTIAAQDCTLDATYSDMYDGSSPYLKVGGINEPKKALMRFQISEKPTFGDAELKYGELGFYTTGVTMPTSSVYPEFNIYKLKSSPDGQDWNGDGKIRNVPRGKKITRMNSSGTTTLSWASDNSVRVENHQLQTGDRIWWSPVKVRFNDVNIDGLVAEVEYYAIRIDRDNIKFAASISDAVAGTAVPLNTTSSNHTPAGSSSGSTAEWGYVRSDKYSMDIHVVSARQSNKLDSLAENFDGSEYRETDRDFMPIQRTIMVRTTPYITATTDLVDQPNDDSGNQGTEGKGWLKFGTWFKKESQTNVKNWYGDGGSPNKILLTSHKTESDGSGWWRTTKPAPTGGGGHDYVKKGASSIKWESEAGSTEPLPYGDEVTPKNSIFWRIRGAAEFQQASETEDTENVLQATGAIRFSSTKKLTGGQACNIYQFWKEDGIGVTYPSTGSTYDIDDRQECMMLIRGIPFPTKNWANIEEGKHGMAQYPINLSTGYPGADKATGEDDLCVSMTVNFDKLEKAYSYASTATTDKVTSRRGFHVIFSSSAPKNAENYYDYVDRIFGGAAGSNVLAGGHASCGYSIINTNLGLRLFTLDGISFDDTTANYPEYGKDIFFNAVRSDAAVAQDNCTNMEEGQWYTFKTFFPAAANQQGALVIEDGEGIQVHDKLAADATTYPPVILKNIKDHTALPWYTKKFSTATVSHDWWHNMSIWVTNTKTQYDSVGDAKGLDWMADEEDRDTSNNIYIDRIGITGVNIDHDNATIGQEGGGKSKIIISGGNKANVSDDDGAISTSSVYSVDKREKRTDSVICLGFEDPSQILSDYRREKSWRYLFWHGYTSSNISADKKLTWTADDTLPLTTYAEDGDDYSQEWFTRYNNALNEFIASDGASGVVNDSMYLDAGAPYTYSDKMGALAPSMAAFYSDNNVTQGAQAADEVIDIRELYRNHTANVNTDAFVGAKLPMFTTCPRIGIIFHGVNGVTSKLITVFSGPQEGSKTYWNSGQKICYFNGGLASCPPLVTATGLFNDTPNPYYWEYVSDSTGYLHLTYQSAVDGSTAGDTAINVLDQPSGTAGYHFLYEWDYYNNRKYYVDGFSSKGLSRFILQPTLTPTSSSLHNKTGLAGSALPYGNNGSAVYEDANNAALSTLTGSDVPKMDLTKRENMFCAAKIIDIDGGVTPENLTSAANLGFMTCRVDTTIPLRSTPDTTYRAWLVGDGNIYASGLKIKILDSERIKIYWDGKSNGSGGVGLIMTAITGTGGTEGLNYSSASALTADYGDKSTSLSRLWIGPEKYWVNFLLRNQSGDSTATASNLPNKTYNTVSVCSPFGNSETHEHGTATHYDAWGVPGATYNESVYNADKVGGVRGAYINQWNPVPSTNANETIYDMADYGFGGVTEDADGIGGDNGVLGGYAGRFTPRENSVNRVKLTNIFSAGSSKKEGDYLDLAMQQETLSSDAIMAIASTDNNAFPKPFLLTVFEDIKPENPTEFKVAPYEKDAFHPEFTWSASDGDLWYGFIIIDDIPINNQYHRSVLHVPMNEDLKLVASKYDNTKGWYYSAASAAKIYGHRYYNTTKAPTGVFAGSSLLAGNHTEDYGAFDSNERRTAVEAYIWDNVEGLAGNTKHFDGTSYLKYSWDAEDSTNSAFTYPVDEMSIVAHITPNAWAINAQLGGANWAYTDETEIDGGSNSTADLKVGMRVTGLGIPEDAYIVSIDDTSTFTLSAATTGGPRALQTLTFTTRNYICSLNEANDVTLLRDSWGMYIDDEGQINAFIGAAAAATHPTTYIELKSTTKVPIDGTPTNIILTVDTQIHSGNVKLFINGRLEDQSGMRGTLSKNNWPTDADGLGGDNIFYDTDGDEDLYIGAKSASSAVAQQAFEGKMEEFTLYDKVIYPVIPQNGSFVLDKPIEELSVGSSSSSKAYVARLFIKDYHNIRGKTTEEVAASSQVSFKKAAFELNTVVV